MRINHLFKHWYLGSEAFEKDCFWSDLSRRENWDSLNKTKRWDDFSERERRFYINDNNKPELDFSISHLKEYFKKSYKNSQMDEQYFWSEDIYSGLYKPIPSEQELQKVKYIVRYSPVKGDPIEKRIGDFYIYKK